MWDDRRVLQSFQVVVTARLGWFGRLMNNAVLTWTAEGSSAACFHMSKALTSLLFYSIKLELSTAF